MAEEAPAPPIPGFELWQQGAEARLYSGEFLGRPAVLKHRFSKSYRHPTLDEKLTKARLTAEARSLLRCRRAGVPCPALLYADPDAGVLVMERLSGQTARDFLFGLPEGADADRLELAARIGRAVARLHAADIIHGDLTTSNMMLRQGPGGDGGSGAVAAAAGGAAGRLAGLELCVIDFGLTAVKSGLVEEMGVDLYVLERALLSTHPNSEPLMAEILRAYAAELEARGVAAKPVLKRFESVRQRGRKRLAFG